MDGTLPNCNFENLKIVEISKKFFWHHLNIFKSCIDFQNYEGEALKLSLFKYYYFHKVGNGKEKPNYFTWIKKKTIQMG